MSTRTKTPSRTQSTIVLNPEEFEAPISGIGRAGVGLDRADLRLRTADRRLSPGALQQCRGARPAGRRVQARILSRRAHVPCTVHTASQQLRATACLKTRTRASRSCSRSQPSITRAATRRAEQIIRCTPPRLASRVDGVPGLISVRERIVPGHAPQQTAALIGHRQSRPASLRAPQQTLRRARAHPGATPASRHLTTNAGR